MEFLEFISVCREKNLYIQTHNFPDPDAIASAYGLQQLLLHYGIAAKICYEGRIDKLSTSKLVELLGIEMYAWRDICDTMHEDDYIICVDSQKNAGNITDIVGEEVACIDHHPTVAAAQYLYSNIRMVGACATLIAGLYRTLGVTPDPKTATALIYGIKMDTLQFARGVTEEDIAVFGYLFALRDERMLTWLERNNMEFTDLSAYGAAIKNIHVYGNVGITHIPFACPDAMIGILSDFILSLVEVEVAVVYSRREDGWKLSFRSETSDVDAGVLAHEALAGWGSGGGHAVMAGGLIAHEDLPLLGSYPDDALRDALLREIRRQCDAKQLIKTDRAAAR